MNLFCTNVLFFALVSDVGCSFKRLIFLVWQAASFGGSNIDPTAWEDKKCRGESRFPAQVGSQSVAMTKFLKYIAFSTVEHS